MRAARYIATIKDTTDNLLDPTTSNLESRKQNMNNDLAYNSLLFCGFDALRIYSLIWLCTRFRVLDSTLKLR